MDGRLPADCPGSAGRQFLDGYLCWPTGAPCRTYRYDWFGPGDLDVLLYAEFPPSSGVNFPLKKQVYKECDNYSTKLGLTCRYPFGSDSAWRNESLKNLDVSPFPVFKSDTSLFPAHFLLSVNQRLISSLRFPLPYQLPWQQCALDNIELWTSRLSVALEGHLSGARDMRHIGCEMFGVV